MKNVLVDLTRFILDVSIAHQSFSLIKCWDTHRPKIRVKWFRENVMDQVLSVFQPSIQTLTRRSRLRVKLV